MRNMLNEDKFRKVDFDSAFSETPSVVRQAILKAQGDIYRYEKRKRIVRISVSAVSACLIIFAGISALLMRGGGISSDQVTPPVFSQSEIKIDMETPVYTCKEDPYYHSDINCASAYENSVELPLITAIEFEKAACPACASHLDTGAEPEDVNNVQTGIVQNRSDSVGAVEELEKHISEGASPVFSAEFFGGSLNIYALENGTYIGNTDPTPDKEVLKYIMIGRKEMNAEMYYEMNGGPGIYDKFDPDSKMLVTSWGDEYETHVYYEYIVEAEIKDQTTGECVWRMNREQYDAFINDGTFTASERADVFQPNLSAALS